MKKIALTLALILAVSCMMISCGKKNKTPFDDFYDYDLSKYVEVAKDDYIGISYTAYSITQDDVDTAVYELQKSHATYSEFSDRVVQNGDIVNIDYKGFMDGEEMDNASEKGAEFELGNAGYIPGFQEGIVGHSVGETFTVDATFPKDYGVEELNGKTAQFEMTLNAAKVMKLPPLTDEFIKENTEYETFEEYYASLSSVLDEKYASSILAQQKNEALSTIYKNVKVLDYPKDEMEQYRAEYVSQMITLAAQSGMQLDEYLSTNYKMTVDDFNLEAENYAKSSVASDLILFSIARAEGIDKKLTQKDYDKYLEKISAEYLSTPEEFEANYGSEAVWKSLLFDTVMDFVLANGKAVEIDASDMAPEIELIPSDSEEGEKTDNAEESQDSENGDEASEQTNEQ